MPRSKKRKFLLSNLKLFYTMYLLSEKKGGFHQDKGMKTHPGILSEIGKELKELRHTR